MSTDLYSEVRGAGPVLLLIPGGNGDAGFYGAFAEALSGDFTVVTYDRRGFSRSPLAGPVDDNRLLDIDVDDARTLLKSVEDGPGFVFGSSAGAIVALHLLTRHPDDVRVLVAHEPPLVRLLPDAEDYAALFDDIHDTFRRRGTRRAMRKFVAAAGFGPPRFGTVEFWRMAKLMPRIRRNMTFSLEHEIRTYPRYQPDISALQQVSAKLVLAGGWIHGSSFRIARPLRWRVCSARRSSTLPAAILGIGTTPANSPANYADFWRRNDFGK